MLETLIALLSLNTLPPNTNTVHLHADKPRVEIASTEQQVKATRSPLQWRTSPKRQAKNLAAFTR